MNLKPNHLRIALIFFWIITWIGLEINNYDYESSMLFVNISLSINLILIMFNSSLISTKMILSFLMYTVALVPGLAYYLMGFKLYSYVNFDHQLNDQVTIMTLWLFWLSSNIYTYVVLEKDTPLPTIKTKIKGQTRLPFYFICAMFLIFCYIADSGSTLLTAGYEQIREERSAFITLAGVALTAFWADGYGKMRVYLADGRKQRVFIFWAVTFIGMLWLVLHARRTEAIGFICIILIHQRLQTGKTPYKYMFMALMLLFLLYFVGYLRVGAIQDLNVIETIMDSLRPTFEGGSSRTEFANMPSGLGNITATMQTSVYHFDYLGHEFLNGTTIFAYPFKLLPTNIVVGFNLADPDTYFYNSLVLEKYYYNGGTFLYAPAYGNFGIVGLVVSSFLMGLLVNWTQKSIRSYDFLRIVISSIIIFTFIKVCWYNFLPMVKAIVYNLIMLFYVGIIFMERKQKKTKLSLA